MFWVPNKKLNRKQQKTRVLNAAKKKKKMCVLSKALSEVTKQVELMELGIMPSEVNFFSLPGEFIF